MLFVCHPEMLHKHCLQFLLGVKMAPRETENNAYAKFWGDKQRALWYVMVFSGVVNCFFDVLLAVAVVVSQGPFKLPNDRGTTSNGILGFGRAKNGTRATNVTLAPRSLPRNLTETLAADYYSTRFAAML